MNRIRNARPSSQRPHRNKEGVKARLHWRDDEWSSDTIRNARPSSQRPHRNKGGVKARVHWRDVERSSVTEDSGGSQPPSRQHRRGRARSASYARGRQRKY